MDRSIQSPSARASGVTMIELMVTLAIAAILAGVAAPSFRSFLVNERIRSASFNLVAHLVFARSEAIKRNAGVTITSAGTSGAWAPGWSITSGADTIKTQQAYSKLDITASGGASSLVYNSSGRLASPSTISFQVADSSDGINAHSRCVTVGPTGMPISRTGSC